MCIPRDYTEAVSVLPVSGLPVSSLPVIISSHTYIYSSVLHLNMLSRINP